MCLRRELLEKHLDTCAECRDELIKLLDAASLLAHTANSSGTLDLRSRPHHG